MSGGPPRGAVRPPTAQGGATASPRAWRARAGARNAIPRRDHEQPDRAPLGARLSALAERFYERAHAEVDPRHVHGDPLRAFLLDEAASLAELARRVREEYVRLEAEGERPTNAQGVALARFLRPAFRDRTVGAHVCRGGAGLPAAYLYVRLTDGYEAGIAPDGRVST